MTLSDLSNFLVRPGASLSIIQKHLDLLFLEKPSSVLLSVPDRSGSFS